MKCYNHHSVDAVSGCRECGRGLCPNCSDRFNSFCNNCIAEAIDEGTTDLKKQLFLVGTLFIVGFSYAFITSFSVDTDLNILLVILLGFINAIGAGYTLGAIPMGWQGLNKITPDMFLFMPIGHWVIFYLVKLSLAVVVGFFIAPFVFFKMFKEYKIMRMNKQEVA